MREFVLFVVVLGLPGSVSMAVTSDANDPPWKNMINSNGKVMEEEVGNYSIALWNANPDSMIFNLEDLSVTYPKQGDQLSSIIQHTAHGSPVCLQTFLDPAVPFGRILDGAAMTRASSGSVSLAYNCRDNGEVIIRFTNWNSGGVNYAPLLGVGMVLNRLTADVGITLYRTDDSVIDTFTAHANSGVAQSEFSFFGYVGTIPEIAKVRIDTSLLRGNQLWLDDLSMLDGTVPEPASMVVVPLSSLFLACRRK